LEDFSHTVYVLALDGYEKCEDDALEDIATEAFLRGCKEKEAAIKAMEKNPVTLSKAIKFVKTSLANQKAIFGSTKNILVQRQVTFSDTEGTNSKEKENSHMQRQTCLEQEIKTLSSLVGKLSSSIEDNVIERRKERQRSSSPVTGYTPGYKSPPRYMPQYRSQSPLQTYNSGRSSPQSVNSRPRWNSPNRRQQFSPSRGGYQSTHFRKQGIGQDQYQGQNKGCTPTSEQGRRQGQYQGQNKDFTLISERQFRDLESTKPVPSIINL
jgi:hypothetical protein